MQSPTHPPTHLPISQLPHLFPFPALDSRQTTPTNPRTPQSHNSVLNGLLLSHPQAMLILHLLPPRACAPVLPPPADEPVERDDEDDDAVDGGDVVHIYTRVNPLHHSQARDNAVMRGGEGGGRREKRGSGNSLPGSTGITTGKLYMTSVKAVHSSSTIFAKSPNLPSQKGPCGMLSRPRMRRQVTGMA